MHKFRKLLKYIELYKYDIAIVIFAITCVAGSLLAIGQIFKTLIDGGINHKHQTAINHSIIYICVLIIIFGISSFLRSYFINSVAEKIASHLRNDAIINLLRLDTAYFEEVKTGNIVSCLIGDIEIISKMIVNILSFSIRNFFMLIGSVVFMFLHSYKLSLIVLSIVPILLIIIMRLGKNIKSLSKNILSLQGDIASNLTETFLNIHTIHAFNQQNNKEQEFLAQSLVYIKNTTDRLKMRAIFFSFSISIILMAITFVIWIGSNDIITGSISSGQMVSFIYYAIIAAISAGGIIESFSESQKPIAAFERVLDLIDVHTNQDVYNNHITDTKSLRRKEQIVIFNDVDFVYSTRPNINILNNLSFAINKGEFIGIVGKSGVGKSTIMQLLLGFYRVNSGNIVIKNDNELITNIHKIRESCAYVPQEPAIFCGTIKTNIAFSRPNASEKEIIEAARISGVIDFAKNLPQGLDTAIGERGVNLSGGQKQRIAISRAILYNPEVLLLDEATSAIDSASEQQLLMKLRDSLQQKTIISIAHRISSIEDADRIFVIDKGSVSAIGSHNELLKLSRTYRTLCEEQMIL